MFSPARFIQVLEYSESWLTGQQYIAMRIETVDTEFYAERLSALEQVAQLAPEHAASEIRHLTEMLLWEAAPSLDLVALEEELAKASDLDLDALDAATAELAALELPVIHVGEEREINPREEADKLAHLVTLLRENQATLHRNDVWFQLEFGADRHLRHLLLCAAKAGLRLPVVEKKALDKLQLLSELALTQQWARVQREFEATRGMPHLDGTSPILPDQFLELSEPETLRSKLVQFVFRIKPALIVEAISKGVDSYPLEALGPARLLAINTTVVPLETDRFRLDLVHRLGSLASICRNLHGESWT